MKALQWPDVIPLPSEHFTEELRWGPDTGFTFYRDGARVRDLDLFEDRHVMAAFMAGQQVALPVAVDFDRRVRVEQRLLDAASGKAPMPTQEECRELAYILGIPDGNRIQPAQCRVPEEGK